MTAWAHMNLVCRVLSSLIVLFVSQLPVLSAAPQTSAMKLLCQGTPIAGYLSQGSPDVPATNFIQFMGDLCKEDPYEVVSYWICNDCITRCPDRLSLMRPQGIIISKDRPPNDIKVNWYQTNFVSSVSGACVLTDQSMDGSEGSTDALRSFSKTSVLFVSISFIILMVISLAWLVFYYVQRFRYAHAKDRLQRRLFNAARKALARIPTRAVRSGDDELETDCAVCLDPYQLHDIVRILPCKHTYHKSCIDPWLLEHRTCPMCKGDILKYFGYQEFLQYGEGQGRSEEANPRNEISERDRDRHVIVDEMDPSPVEVPSVSARVPSSSTPASLPVRAINFLPGIAVLTGSDIGIVRIERLFV